MKIKHWQGYGSVNAVKVKDPNCTLHVRVSGNHEWGLVPSMNDTAFNWILKRFDKSMEKNYFEWRRDGGIMQVDEGWDEKTKTDICDYRFIY